MYFLLYLLFIIFQRITELLVSKRNEIWLRSHGAIEYGKGHYPYIVVMHVLFLISMAAEFIISESGLFRPAFLAIQIGLIALKIWVISSLGNFWNTKIFRIPGTMPVRKGPYKFADHPNYIIVIAEIIVIPLVFNLVYTAAIFSILNAVMLYIRIREEYKVWAK